jgi:hypothetical protein
LRLPRGGRAAEAARKFCLLAPYEFANMSAMQCGLGWAGPLFVLVAVACSGDWNESAGGVTRTSSQSIEGESDDVIARPTTTPMRECSCPNGRCADTLAAVGSESLSDVLPLRRPPWCEPTPWAGAYRGSLMLLSGCGFVGIRETSEAMALKRSQAVERWYAVDTGQLVGRSASSTDLALSCQGTLPPPDCKFAICNVCGPDATGKALRESCDRVDLGLVAREGERL